MPGRRRDPVAGFQQPGPQRRQVHVEQDAVAFDHPAGDENSVYQAGMACGDDRGRRVGGREHGQVVGAQQDHVGVLAGREAAGPARRARTPGHRLANLPSVAAVTSYVTMKTLSAGGA